MLSGPSFRSTFVLQYQLINPIPLILSGFPLTSFHLAEASLSCNQPVLFAELENVNELWNNNRTVHVNERNQNKSKTKSRHIQIDHASYYSIQPTNNVRDNKHMTSMKIAQLSRPPTPLSMYVQNSSTPLTLGIQFQTNHLPAPNEDQSIKRKHNRRMIMVYYHVLPSGRLSFSASTH